jgi:tRNA modification GTPase
VNLEDTIVAISTPPGRGGVGVVRLAGPEARTVAGPMLRLKHQMEQGRALFGELVDPASGSRIDEVVVTFFQKPHSYTTDDIVEISCHGAPLVLRHVVDCAVQGGARLAEPGEFTMRAFLNGRIDLAQAEAVRDLIESRTLYQAKVAAQQMGGALSHRLQPQKQKLVELIAALEAGIDFAEDDVDVVPAAQIRQRIAEICQPLSELAGSFAFGQLVNEGLVLAIVGRPNVGKSSLFNRLVERERAIVTATPGTTRDLVSETVSLDGIPVKLIDTAGLRWALDEAEAIGIRKSMEALADADVVILVVDASQPPSADDEELAARLADRPAILVENKADLPAPKTVRFGGRLTTVRTSALRGEGLQDLKKLIIEQVAGNGAQFESGFLTNARHRSLVARSLDALAAADGAAAAGIPHEMLLLDLYNALRSLDEITGATTTDDILNLIFSTFCIGK